jgi:hypothetical protein
MECRLSSWRVCQHKLKGRSYYMRQIITSKNRATTRATATTAAVQVPDEYLTKVLKLIPAEVVSLYVALAGIVGVAGQTVNAPLLFWIVFVVCLVGTPLYLMRIAKVSDTLQIGISTFAFIVWVFALGGPFASLGWYQPIYGALLLPIFTFFAPMIMP